MHAGASREVRHRDDWVRVMGARRDEEWAPPVRLRRWGIVVEPRTDAHSTSRLAPWSLEERAGVAPSGEWSGAAQGTLEVAPLSWTAWCPPNQTGSTPAVLLG